MSSLNEDSCDARRGPQLRAGRQPCPAPTSRCRTCRSGRDRPADDGAPWRSATRSLDLRGAQDAGLLDEPSGARAGAERADGGRAGTAGGAAARLFALLADGSPEQGGGRAPAAPRPAAQRRAAGPRSARSPTSSPRCTTPSAAGACRGGPRRCRRPSAGCRSPTTAGPARSASSGDGVHRPQGQRRGAGRRRRLRPQRRRWISSWSSAPSSGGGNPLGQPLHIDAAARALWGYCLLNDWSSRDVQAWESDPLGPFLCKSFSTTDLTLGRDGGGPAAVPDAGAGPAGRRPGAPAVPGLRRGTRPRGDSACVMEALLLTPAMRRRRAGAGA